MIKYYTLVFSILVGIPTITFSQKSIDTIRYYTVELEAQVQESPAQITLSWAPFKDATNITVFRKTKNSTTWGNSIASLNGNATSYVDNNVASDEAYEYFVLKAGNTVGTGYIYAGIKTPAIHNRGAMMLIVDSTFIDSCKAEIDQLMEDISADGWELIRKDFLRTTRDVTVRNYIISQKQSNPNLVAVLILGHIAVPYSGNLNPDAHPNHKGAWPADAYYADVDGTWTDNSVNTDNNGSSLPSRTENKNLPNDGKWDQSTLPSPADLQVSRIDFANMPAFSSTEVQMMKRYLDKDHQFKTGALSVTKRGLIDDNFGTSTMEPFSSGGLRLTTIVGRNNITAKDFMGTLNTDDYLWAYGCGGGSYTSCGGVGTTNDFTTKNTNAIFTMLFGSYFGDWDAQNNFLRAPLCTNTPALTSCWSGRPHWFFHHMALGENIGYSIKLAQNNGGANPLYNVYYNNSQSGVHIALMGDLTLRTEYAKPAASLSMTSNPAWGATLSWSASAETGLAGYYVYRSESEFGSYERVSNLVTGTSFTDSVGTSGTKYYMVRAVKLQQTPSGTYYNLSLGTKTSGHADYPYSSWPASVISIQSLADCISIFPNPAKQYINVLITSTKEVTANCQVTDLQGRILLKKVQQLHKGDNTVIFDIEKLPAGIYMMDITSNGNYHKKWIKIN